MSEVFGPELIEKLIKAIIQRGKEDVDKIDDIELKKHVEREVEMVANEAYIYLVTAYMATLEGMEKAMDYFFGDHDLEEYKRFLGGKNDS